MLSIPSPRRMFLGSGISLLIIFSLAGCGGKPAATPTQNPSDVFTQVAQQVSAGLTQTAAAKPPATLAPSIPTDMPAPAQGPTVAALATIAGQVGGPTVAPLPAGAEPPTLEALPPTAESSSGGGTETTKCKYRAGLGYESPKDESWIQEKKNFKRIWLLANVGDCPWPAGTYLRLVSGEIFGGSATEVITDTAVPVGENVRVETQMQVPALPAGTKKLTMESNWMLGTPDGHLFGSGADGKGYFWINLVVCEEKTCKEEE